MSSTSMSSPKGQTSVMQDQKFQLLLFKLGEEPVAQRNELFGINVFKVREIVVAPAITAVVNAPKFNLGVANVRGQLIPVIDLPGVMGCTPKTDAKIVLVTEFARTTQAFLVDEVVEIIQLDWKYLLASDGSGAGLVSGIARVDGDVADSRLAQVLDVEEILRKVSPSARNAELDDHGGAEIRLPAGSVVLFVDDSVVARRMVEESLKKMNVPFIVAKNGKEAWERLAALSDEASAQGKRAKDKVALVLTDLEMPEMDGFTLTNNIKHDPRYAGIPVVVYSSLTGSASEGHASSVGADAYVAKFEPRELRESIRKTLANFQR